MTLFWQKAILSLCVLLAFALLAYFLYRLINKNNNQKYIKLLGAALKRAVLYISILLSIYIIIIIWDLPEAKLIIANKFLSALAIIASTLIISSVATGIFIYYKKSSQHGIAAATLSRNIVNASIIILGLLILLNHLGIAIAPLLTPMGIGGIAIALGLQDTLSNIFAGIYIIWAGRMKIGDYIKLNTGEEGYVHDIAWRETRIRMNLDNIITIPNSLIAKTSITNYNRPDKEIGFNFYLGVDYTSDLDHVEQVTLEVARNILQTTAGGLAQFEPTLRFFKFADSSIDMIIKMRVKDYASQSLVTHELIKQLHKRYSQENITLPFPTRTVLMNTKQNN